MSRIKEALFSIFGEGNLPSVNMNTGPTELSRWKTGPAKECYKKLFEPISNQEDSQVTYMSRILEKVWSDTSKASDVLVAFAVSVCESILSPNIESIQIKEEILKQKLKKNEVCFTILCKQRKLN